MKKNSRVVLSGGLGNQLFQYATALHLSRFGNVSLESNLGSPRVDPMGNLDLLGFGLSNDVPISKGSSSPFITNVLQYILKISSITFSRKIFVKLLNWTRSFLRFILKRFAVFPDGVGFSQTDLLRHRAKFVIGNFHSYKWFDDEHTLSRLRDIHLRSKPSWLAELEIRATVEMPIVVHVRRGDYTGIRELGILQNNYFQSALKNASINFPNSKIWVFSDNFQEAEHLLPSEYSEKYIFITQEPWNSVAHLEAMRLGYCFVISNSTFSWWAAFLRYKQSAPVYCPEKWFLTKPNPDSMIPSDWIRVSL